MGLTLAALAEPVVVVRAGASSAVGTSAAAMGAVRIEDG
jgi:hypothetical protein